MTRVRVYIGLGSNLGQPQEQLREALNELDQMPQTRLQLSSSFYLSSPMGPSDQPDFVNGVAELVTELPPLELLDQLQAIEHAHGRERGMRWGPRTLDLDLLLYGDQVMHSERLTVPHPGIAKRAFVLAPLAEIAPTLEVPGLGDVASLWAASVTGHVELIS